MMCRVCVSLSVSVSVRPSLHLSISPSVSHSLSLPVSLSLCVSYPAGVVDDAEVGFVLQLPWFLELGVRTLLLHQLIHKRLICSFGKPALLIQQSQNTWGVRL